LFKNSLSKLSLSEIPDGISKRHLPEIGDVFISRSGSEVRSCTTRCQHSGGRLCLIEGTSIAKCTRHGWELDLRTMSYINPVNGPKHPEIDVSLEGAECTFIKSINESIDYKLNSQRELKGGEFKFEFWTHACGVITVADQTITTDPWLVGPAFIRGWWLEHQPPADWLERLLNTDFIYISHNHSDHLNSHTLELLRDAISERGKREPIFIIPDFQNQSVEIPLRSIGFENFLKLQFFEWINLADYCRVMLLPDASGRSDSALVVDYKGHLLLNTVDCANPASLNLPSEVDIWLGAFAGGASGYPICWTEQYGVSVVKKMLAQNKKTGCQRIQEIASACKPKIAVPFAGYFNASHPSDCDVSALLQKRTWRDFEKSVRKANPSTAIWLPTSGAEIDLGIKFEQNSQATKYSQDKQTNNHNFKKYTDIVDSVAKKFPDTDENVSLYFRWAGFRDSMILNLVEFDDQFEIEISNRTIDLQTQTVVQLKPERERFLRIKVRWSVLRWLFVTGASWEEMAIGFQARFFRVPDAYEFNFWDHFQNNLPPTPPLFIDSSSPRV
jgi:CMP-N-acetylneuraminate monooxygenase